MVPTGAVGDAGVVGLALPLAGLPWPFPSAPPQISKVVVVVEVASELYFLSNFIFEFELEEVVVEFVVVDVIEEEKLIGPEIVWF